MRNFLLSCLAIALCTQGMSAQQILTKLEREGRLCYEVDQKDDLPFSPTWQLEFCLPDTSLVTVEVREILSNKDSSGRAEAVPVRQLIKQTLAPGAYRVNWDAKDSSGKRVHRGLYIFFIRMFRERGLHKTTFEAQTKIMPA